MTKALTIKSLWTKLSIYLLGTFLLCIPAFYNGFPLVYSDTGTYIRSGMELYLPSDRPMFYGLFIRVFSLAYSLWFVVIAQSVFCSIVLIKLLKFVYPKISNTGIFAIVSFMAACTSLPWYTSQLMPDMFTFTALGSIVLLGTKSAGRWYSRVALIFIALFSLNAHFTNTLIVLGLILLCITLRIGRKSAFEQLDVKRTTLVLLCSVALSLITNYAISHTVSLSKGGHVFLMGRMLDNGVLQSFLDDNCNHENYTLCTYKDSLPTNSRDFLWSANSPVHKMNGWEATKQPFNKILKGIFTSPKHLVQFVYTSATASISQLFQNDIGSGLVSTWYAKPSSPPYQAVQDFFPNEMNSYLQSRQNENLWGQGLNFTYKNILNSVLLTISSIIIVFGFGAKKNREHISPTLKIASFVLLSGVVVNAMVVASLANVYDRLQARISWVIVLVALLLVLQLGAMWYRSIKKNIWTFGPQV